MMIRSLVFLTTILVADAMPVESAINPKSFQINIETDTDSKFGNGPVDVSPPLDAKDDVTPTSSTMSRKLQAYNADLPPTQLSCSGKYYKIQAEQKLANGTKVIGQWCMEDHRGPNLLSKSEAAGLQFATLNRSPKKEGELGPVDMYGIVYRIDHPSMSGTFIDYDDDGNLQMHHTNQKSAEQHSPPASLDEGRIANGFQYVPYDDDAEVREGERVTLTAKWYAQNRWNGTDTHTDPLSPFYKAPQDRRRMERTTAEMHEQGAAHGASNVFGANGALLVTRVGGKVKDQDTPVDVPVLADVADLQRVLPYYGARLVPHGEYLPAPPPELFDIFLVSYQLSEDFQSDFVYGGSLPKGIAEGATCNPGNFTFGECAPPPTGGLRGYLIRTVHHACVPIPSTAFRGPTLLTRPSCTVCILSCRQVRPRPLPRAPPLRPLLHHEKREPRLPDGGWQHQVGRVARATEGP